jgi:peptidyl-dipeptidase Dcp
MPIFPRKGKRNGAWMTSYKSHNLKNKIKDRTSQTYVISRNLQKQNLPIDFNEVLTLFHEFGHGLHGMLAKHKLNPSLTG